MQVMTHQLCPTALAVGSHVLDEGGGLSTGLSTRFVSIV